MLDKLYALSKHISMYECKAIERNVMWWFSLEEFPLLFPDGLRFTHPSCGKQKWNMEQIKSWNNTAQHVRFTIHAALITESILLRAWKRKECSFQIGAREETSGVGNLPRKEENQIQIASPHYIEHNPRPAVLHDKSHASG